MVVVWGFWLSLEFWTRGWPKSGGVPVSLELGWGPHTRGWRVGAGAPWGARCTPAPVAVCPLSLWGSAALSRRRARAGTSCPPPPRAQGRGRDLHILRAGHRVSGIVHILEIPLVGPGAPAIRSSRLQEVSHHSPQATLCNDTPRRPEWGVVSPHCRESSHDIQVTCSSLGPGVLRLTTRPPRSSLFGCLLGAVCAPCCA